VCHNVGCIDVDAVKIDNHRLGIHLISFEKTEDLANTTECECIASYIACAGIAWHPLRYHKWPFALATALVHRLRIAHARSYVPPFIALVLKRIAGVKRLLNIRGFWTDERVDGGLWPAGGRLYRVAKWFERRFLLNANQVVSLTQAAEDEMRTFLYLQGRMLSVTVIPICADPVRTPDFSIDKSVDQYLDPLFLDQYRPETVGLSQ